MSESTFSNARQKRLEVRLTDDELDFIDLKASKKNMTRSAFVREAALYDKSHSPSAMDWMKLKNFAKFNSALSDLESIGTHTISEINRIGGNINQIARQVNASAKANGSAQLDKDMLYELRSVRDELKKISNDVYQYRDAVQKLKTAVANECGDE